jgi:hypothetical protein
MVQGEKDEREIGLEILVPCSNMTEMTSTRFLEQDYLVQVEG